MNAASIMPPATRGYFSSKICRPEDHRSIPAALKADLQNIEDHDRTSSRHTGGRLEFARFMSYRHGPRLGAIMRRINSWKGISWMVLCSPAAPVASSSGRAFERHRKKLLSLKGRKFFSVSPATCATLRDSTPPSTFPRRRGIVGRLFIVSVVERTTCARSAVVWVT